MNLIQTIVEYTTPSSCLACGREPRLLCSDCAPRAITRKVPSCYRCNAQNQTGETCQTCKRASKLAGVSIVARYDELPRTLIRLLKYERSSEAGRLCAAQMAALADVRQVDAVVAVPTSPAHRRQRGYDQAELLAREVAHRLGLPYFAALVRLKNVHQVGASRAQRMSQGQDLFAPVRELGWRGKRLLLVDDVVTTGATLTAAAAALRAGGAKRVWGLAMARD